MKKMFFIGILSLLFVSRLSAQVNAADSQKESKRLMDLFQKLEGTYQVQVIDSRDKTEIPLSIMDTILAKRNISEVVYFPLRNNVRVMILPFSVINKNGFKPIERIANISSATIK